MNEEELIRTLAAHAADAVVLLEKIWPDDAFPAKLCDRVDASDYFITNRGAVIASDLRVPFLAEQVGAVGISSADVHTHWKIVVIYQPDIRLTYAARTTAWNKKPRFPGLDLSDREVDLVYEMCDTLSRNRAYVEKDFSTETALFPTFSAIRRLSSRSVLSMSLGSSSCCRMTRLPCRFSRPCCLQACGVTQRLSTYRIF